MTRHPAARPRSAHRALKRAFDLVASALALLVLSPMLLIIAAFIFFADGRPVLFRQERAGHAGHVFRISKFRTMSLRRGADAELLRDQGRVTTLGRWLRRTSLDELPELLNLVAGDTSLVGPRPLPVDNLPLYNETERRRHEVRRGLTGLAQVSGRNRLNWQERFALDVQYFDGWTIWLDLKILARTLSAVIRGRGVEAKTGFTSEPFRGSSIKREAPERSRPKRPIGWLTGWSDIYPTSPRRSDNGRANRPPLDGGNHTLDYRVLIEIGNRPSSRSGAHLGAQFDVRGELHELVAQLGRITDWMQQACYPILDHLTHTPCVGTDNRDAAG
jgi:lipopolysaccharide/colanic/teichoic acid biosynthesis glycosyltransferase